MQLVPAREMLIGDVLAFENEMWRITNMTFIVPPGSSKEHVSFYLENGDEYVVPANLLIPRT